MRIAFITTMTTAPWGGSEALWAETVHRAIDAGHEVFVSVYDWPTPPPAVVELMKRGARIDRRKLSRRWRRSRILMRLFNPFRPLREFRPHVVLINQGGTYDISRSKEFRQLRRALLQTDRWPFVLLCHCEQQPPRRERARERARQAFKAARIVGLLSQDLRAKSERQINVSLPHTRLFQNPLNISAARILPWPQPAPLRFAFVGRMEWVKGLDLALGVLGSPAWRARDWQFDIYGNGELQPELEAQVKAMGLSDRIRFPGFATDIDSVWRDHHVLLLPSRAEGVPNSMLEAMLSGRPAVVSNVGGIAGWMQDGETGYLLPKPEAAALEVALERLWSRRADLEQMGRTAFERTLAQRDRDPALTLLGWLEEVAHATQESHERRMCAPQALVSPNS